MWNAVVQLVGYIQTFIVPTQADDWAGKTSDFVIKYAANNWRGYDVTTIGQAKEADKTAEKITVVATFKKALSWSALEDKFKLILQDRITSTYAKAWIKRIATIEELNKTLLRATKDKNQLAINRIQPELDLNLRIITQTMRTEMEEMTAQLETIRSEPGQEATVAAYKTYLKILRFAASNWHSLFAFYSTECSIRETGVKFSIAAAGPSFQTKKTKIFDEDRSMEGFAVITEKDTVTVCPRSTTSSSYVSLPKEMQVEYVFNPDSTDTATQTKVRTSIDTALTMINQSLRESSREMVSASIPETMKREKSTSTLIESDTLLPISKLSQPKKEVA